MADIDALKTAHDDAVVERATMERRRNERIHELMEEAKKQVARQIAEEFPDWQAKKTAEGEAALALEAGRVEAGKERLSRMNYGRGTLVEWDTQKNNWYSPERRHWYYRTGRKGFLAVWERGADYPDNIHHGYALPNPGDLYIRLLKKDGTPSRQFYKFSGGMPAEQILPAGWLPEGERHEKAAPNEP